VLKLAKVAALLTIAGILCGFDDFDFIYGLNAYRGEPVPDAFMRLGPPARRTHIDHRRLYYWHTVYQGGGFVCKIWGTAQHGIVTNWGYHDCAY
jgi:hypothetical protein